MTRLLGMHASKGCSLLFLFWLYQQIQIMLNIQVYCDFFLFFTLTLAVCPWVSLSLFSYCLYQLYLTEYIFIKAHIIGNFVKLLTAEQ